MRQTKHPLEYERAEPSEGTATDVLRFHIAASGMSARQFARRILLRDERTVRRWLAGTSPIPAPVVEFLERTPAPAAVSIGSLDDMHALEVREAQRAIRARGDDALTENDAPA